MFVVTSADKTLNNIVYEKYYIDCLIKEQDIENSFGNPTYTLTIMTRGNL